MREKIKKIFMLLLMFTAIGGGTVNLTFLILDCIKYMKGES